MSFDTFFDRFFGDRSRKGFDKGYYNDTEENNNFNRKSHSSDLAEDEIREFFPDFNFKMMTDPFEMHHLIEQKMNEILQSFNQFGLFSDECPNCPAIEEKVNPRDFCLKPEFNEKKPDNGIVGDHANKGDGDFLDRWFPPSSQQPLSPPTSQQPFSFSYRSITKKTVMLPDGTVKTEETIRNSDGTEQKIVTEKLPDGSSQPQTGWGFPGFFGHSNLPQITGTPKDDLLKPGYENPNNGKVDKDLDQEILLNGVESLPAFSKSYSDLPSGPHERYATKTNKNHAAKGFTKKIVTLPDGSQETELIICKPDGTTERTVTHTPSGYTGSNPENSTVRQSSTLGIISNLLESLFK